MVDVFVVSPVGFEEDDGVPFLETTIEVRLSWVTRPLLFCVNHTDCGQRFCSWLKLTPLLSTYDKIYVYGPFLILKFSNLNL